ncbi:hypothetical protein [Sphingomonas desiccabilis]|uniref:Uncharacterized protein n=1 Tax=Sphingomonas desiccabilis TaxID=429134 RepID=A0A4Q2IU51_9SPHN|nr:hypothetical protein [Sphingomonas desiccabilis]MBB3911512.1 hypothetical protein [Sphingomonas desiccabilis]RXZ31729.1 hypothetical protein EO081_10985 [Sphingomonas desiccabilis]
MNLRWPERGGGADRKGMGTVVRSGVVAAFKLRDLAPSSDNLYGADPRMQHLINPLMKVELTEVAALSPRQFSRAF